MTPGTLPLAAPQSGYEGFIGWVLSLIESLGEVGVGLAVLIETFVPPIPSEAILPVAGFLAYDGRMNAWGAWAAATIGGLVGAWIWYGIGAAIGRNRTRRLVGRVPLLDHDDFDKAEAFFQRWGGRAVLFGRCVPLVRSFISIPAGIERMTLWRFTLYTTIRPVLEQWSGVLSDVAVGAIVLLLLLFIALRIRRRMREAAMRREQEEGSA